MESFRSKIMENPMLIEVLRFGRKFFGVSRLKRANAVFVWLASVVYLLLFLVSLAYREALSSSAILVTQTALLCFIIPSVTYSSIAGEREKRTWELLIVAPISKTQVILGKYLSSVIVVLSVVGLMFPILLLSLNNREPVAGVFAGEITSIGFGLALTAIGILISALTSRTLTAQAMTYSFLMIWLVALPAVCDVLQLNNRGIWSEVLWTHPFVAIESQRMQFRPEASGLGWQYGALPQLLFYDIIAVVALAAAIHSLKRVEPKTLRGA